MNGIQLNIVYFATSFNSKLPTEKIISKMIGHIIKYNFFKFPKLPDIRQAQIGECGLACIAMVSTYYGLKLDINTLRARFPQFGHGMSLEQVIYVSENIGLKARAIKIELEQIKYLQTPCILHWNLDHFVTLKHARKGFVYIHDPAAGVKSFNWKQLSKYFTGFAVELTPGDHFVECDASQQLSLKDFWGRARGLKRSIVQIAILSILLQFAAVVSPLYIQRVVDSSIVMNDLSILPIIALGFTLLLLFQTTTNLLREFLLVYLTRKFNLQMSANLFRHLIRLPVGYFYSRQMGDIVSRFGSLSEVRRLITSGIVSGIVDGLLAAVTLTAMFLCHTNLTLLALFWVGLYCVCRWVFYHPYRRAVEEGIEASAAENTYFMETLRSIQTVKVFGMEYERTFAWQDTLATAINKDITLAKWKTIHRSVNILLFGLASISIIYIAASQVIQNLLSLGMMYAFLSYNGRFVAAVDKLITTFTDYRMLSVHLGRLSDMVHTKRENIDIAPKEKKKKGGKAKKTSLTLTGVAFRYDSRDSFLFENVNFVLPEGTSVLITGPSGCGKSTLLKCILGLYPPCKGSICLGGVDITGNYHARGHIACSLQEDQLLSGDIASNIACFENDFDIEKVKHFAGLACIADEIEGMPLGYHTLIGDMGCNLSSGQKQRILLARALYKRPALLVMDEATSHVDVENEAKIMENLAKIKITMVVVSHRKDVGQKMDFVYALGYPSVGCNYSH